MGVEIVVTAAYIESLNELLRGSVAPHQAYSMGVVSALAWNAGMEPDRLLLERGMGCLNAEEAQGAFARWAARR